MFSVVGDNGKLQDTSGIIYFAIEAPHYQQQNNIKSNSDKKQSSLSFQLENWGDEQAFLANNLFPSVSYFIK